MEAPAETDTLETEPASGSALDQLLGAIAGDAPYLRSAADLLPLQLRAMDERFQQRRRQIKVLDQRAADVGVDGIGQLADVVPLLFSHQTYKSYPESFVSRGQWTMLTKWLGTLMTNEVASVDVSGVSDLDQWADRLASSARHVRASSGTTGKASFLPWSDADLEWHQRLQVAALAWQGVKPENQFAVFNLATRGGPHRPSDRGRVMGEAFGKPGAVHYLFERPASIVEINQMGALRKAMVDGTATPDDLQRYEAALIERQAETERGFERLAELLMGYTDTPVLVGGSWVVMLQLVHAARAKGMKDGALPPGSIYQIGGGAKGANLPDNYEADVHAFFANARYVPTYGMTEINGTMPNCPAGHRHVPSSLLPILLDETGEEVIDYTQCDSAVGRLGLFDFTLDGRWGGVITGDEVEMISTPCTCGFKSPRLRFIRRYAEQAGGDDKLTCAGTIAAYIRGVIEP